MIRIAEYPWACKAWRLNHRVFVDLLWAETVIRPTESLIQTGFLVLAVIPRIGAEGEDIVIVLLNAKPKHFICTKTTGYALIWEQRALYKFDEMCGNR